jgi:hypothetical protein
MSFVIFGHVKARKERTMPKEELGTFRYRILRYTPNLIRDEWVNIGVLLEEVRAGEGAAAPRRSVRVIEEPSEIARVRRLHPNADEELLRALSAELDARFGAPAPEVSTYLEELDQTLSNLLQLSPAKGLLALDFDVELDRLYHDHITPPSRVKGSVIESTRAWIKARLNDVFKRRRVPPLERNIRVDKYTHTGDTFKLDYGYKNGVRGFLHSVALGRDPVQAKVLAYTAERIRARIPQCEFTAITEVEPARDNPRHQFIVQLFEDQQIAVVPLNRAEKFAEELRVRLQ